MPPHEKWARQLEGAKSWEQTLRTLMLAGKALPVLPDEERTENKAIAGCESPVWLNMNVDTQNDDVSFTAYSPSKIVRGLVNILLEPVQGLTVEEFKAFSFPHYFEALPLKRFLSPSRNNGMHAVIEALRAQQQEV